MPPNMIFVKKDGVFHILILGILLLVTAVSSQKYEYVGCFNDDSSERALQEFVGKKMSNSECSSACVARGFQFFGLQWNGQCRCGNNDYDKYGSSDECTCSKFNKGAYLNCVYRNTEIFPPHSQAISNNKYLGCFKDKNKDRALEEHLQGKHTTEQCIVECRDIGHKYAGIQFKRECWFGSGDYNKHGVGLCAPCESNNIGPYTNCVYSTGFSAPSTQPTKEHSNQPSLQPSQSNFPTSYPSKSPSSIPSLSKTPSSKPSSHPSLQPTRSQTPSKDPSNQPTLLPSVHPSKQPTQQPSINPTQTPTQQPSSQPTKQPTLVPSESPSKSRYNYLGCFRDSADRALPKFIGKDLEAGECREKCSENGYKFSGLQYYGQCFCGGKSTYDKHGPRNDCSCFSKNIGSYRSCVWEDNEISVAVNQIDETSTPTVFQGECKKPNKSDPAYFDYENQGNWKHVHGQTHDKKRWDKFPKDVFNFRTENQCGMGRQSPIDLCEENAPCHERHRIYTNPGTWSLGDNRIKAHITGSKLQLEYEEKDNGPYEMGNGNYKGGYKGWCPLIKGVDPSAMCGKDRPPVADFPHHWHGFTQLNNIDIKFPSEHTICGKRYDAELTYWFAWVNRKAAISMSVLVEIGAYNTEIGKMLAYFRQKYNENAAKCHKGRNLLESDNILSQDKNATAHLTKNLRGKKSRRSRDNGNEEILDDLSITSDNANVSRELNGNFNPFSPEIIATEWFYGYWGSMTEPPCMGTKGNPHRFVTWRVLDKPTTMSQSQLDELRNILLTHKDPTCKCTSVARLVDYPDKGKIWSVARDIQSSDGQNVHHCTKAWYTGPITGF